MQTKTDKIINEKLKALSAEQKEKVLDFVSNLDMPKKDIWARLDERLSKVPAEEFAEIPADASSNLKHYLNGLELYESRIDKGYSLTDCISMNVCKEFGIKEVLTHDRHFEQEGFEILL